MVRGGNESHEEPEKRIRFRIGRLCMPPNQQTNAGYQEKESEQVQDPVKSCEQRRTGSNEKATHYKGPDNPPEQDAVLHAPRYSESLEQHHEDKYIVHR